MAVVDTTLLLIFGVLLLAAYIGGGVVAWFMSAEARLDRAELRQERAHLVAENRSLTEQVFTLKGDILELRAQLAAAVQEVSNYSAVIDGREEILLVEDQHAFLLENLLHLYAPLPDGQSQFEIEIASTGYQAIEKLSGPLPDLVLLDLRLPGVGGLVVLEAIHKIDPHLPVIVLSAYGDKSTREQVSAAGARAFFQKPVSTMRLYARIKELLAEAAALALQRGRQRNQTLRMEPDQAELLAKRRRLDKLKERQALFGLNAPVELLIEIEDLEADLAA